MEKPEARTPNSPVRAPQSDTDWQAIDIFVFSNGQQYSPPTKYHLKVDDINSWKSTLSQLAKTQYGPFQSTVDLYTTEGTKVQDPLQLSNMGSYVAVQPPDSFTKAGYDKYLIKASRSWEKRNSRKDEKAVESDVTNFNLSTEPIDNLVLDSKQKNASVVLNKIVSNITNNDASTSIRPQIFPMLQRNTLRHSRPKERNKAPVQSPLLGRKITSSLPEPINNSLKKKDSIKKANTIKITKPESSKPSLTPISRIADATPGNKLASKGKSVRSPLKTQQPMLTDKIIPQVQKVVNELETSSTLKLRNTSNSIENLMTINIFDNKNNIQEKETLQVSNFYENSNAELPSIAENTINTTKDSTTRQDGATIIMSELPSQSSEMKLNSNIKIGVSNIKETISSHDFLESTNINKIIERTFRYKTISKEKIFHEAHQNNMFAQREENLVNSRNEMKISSPNITFHANVHSIERIGTPISSTRKCLVVMAENTKEEIKLANSLTKEAKVSTCKSSETIKIYNNSSSSPRSSIMNKVREIQCITEKTKKTNNSTSMATDHFKTSLKKGDVVNFKVNIEIENHNFGITDQKDNTEDQSVTVFQTENGSQTNIDDQFIRQNKSLLSLVTKEYNNQSERDNHRVIIIQCNYCKYCNERSASDPDKGTHKNFVILLPNEKVEETRDRCNCCETLPEKQASNNLYEMAFSYTSLQTMSKEGALAPARDNVAQSVVEVTDQKNAVTRKKSVSINEESTVPNIREASTPIQEINVKSELIAVSVESIGIEHKVIMVDNWTQTEWCDVLFEARLLHDGHYTFRLPPLEMVKYYKIT